MKKKFLKVKPFQGIINKSYCGPSSFKMVLDYYGVKTTEKKLAKFAGTTEKLGTSAEGIKLAAEHLGFKAEIKDNSTFEDIKKWLKREVPIIVDWFTKGRLDDPKYIVAGGHYSVVVGLDKKFIYLQDPQIGKMRKLRRYDFMTVWFDFRSEFIKPEELVIRRLIAIYK